MSALTPSANNQMLVPIDGTASQPSIAFGGSPSVAIVNGATTTDSGTGIYGTELSIKHSIAGTLALTLDATGLTLASGDVALTAGNVSLTSGNVTLTSGNVALTSGNVTLASTKYVKVGVAIWMVNAGAPTDGVTGAATAGIGSILSDTTNGILYINTGTLNSPTWTKVGTQS